MAEWLKATDCKSVGFSYVGSNPTFFMLYLTTKNRNVVLNLFLPSSTRGFSCSIR